MRRNQFFSQGGGGIKGLYERGVREPLLFIADGLPKLDEEIRNIYPRAGNQLCTTSPKGRRMLRWEHTDIDDDHWTRMKSRGREKIILRKRTVEHPFGTIKSELFLASSDFLEKELRDTQGSMP